MTAPMDRDYLRSVLDYDAETGVLTWLVSGKGRQKGCEAGYVPKRRRGIYREVCINRHMYSSHRLAWFIVTGDWPECEIDHADCDGLNNRWANLRLATQSQNQANRVLQRNNTSGFKGVSFIVRRNKYRALIRVAGKDIWLGWRSTAEEAHALYVAAAKKHFGEYARVA